jgi:DNA-binding CsgD family transcriptional regulator
MEDVSEGQVRSMENLKDQFKLLTVRETQIARLLCMGRRNSEIAKELKISVKTIDTHRLHVMRKIGTKSNTRLLAFALSCGFITLNEALT